MTPLSVTLSLTDANVDALLVELRYDKQPLEERVTEFLTDWIEGITDANTVSTTVDLVAQFAALPLDTQKEILAKVTEQPVLQVRR